MPFEIITDAEAASELGVAVDSRLTRIVAAVHADLYEGTGRTFEKKERTVYLAGFGPRVDYVFLPEAPIESVTEVRIDASGVLGAGTAISDVAGNFWWESADFGFALHYLNGWFPEGPRVVMVKFTGGYNTWATSGGTPPMPPQSMRGMLLDEVFSRYRRGTSERFQSVSIAGTESFTRFADNTGPLAAAIRRYRRPV